MVQAFPGAAGTHVFQLTHAGPLASGLLNSFSHLLLHSCLSPGFRFLLWGRPPLGFGFYPDVLKSNHLIPGCCQPWRPAWKRRVCLQANKRSTPLVNRLWEQKASRRSEAIVVRSDSDFEQLPPAPSISGASLGPEDACYEARARVPPAGRFRAAQCRGRKLEEDVCLVPRGSHHPLQRESGHCLGEPLGLFSFSDSSSGARFLSALLLRKNDHRKSLSCPCQRSGL